MDETNLDSYLPLYDSVPEKWEEGREFLVETLKKISDMVNIRQIGWFLEEELLSGQQFIPTATNIQEYRSVFRKVLDTGALSVGANVFSHGINFDSQFTLTHMYAAATNSSGFTAIPIPNDLERLEMDATNVTITVANAYDRSFVIIEYLLEL